MPPNLRVVTSGCRRFATQASVRGFSGAIGNTPLVSNSFLFQSLLSLLYMYTKATFQILLKGLSEETGCRIYGKAEFQNPGGSVKDRAALGLVRDAEQRGLYDFSFTSSYQGNLVLTQGGTE